MEKAETANRRRGRLRQAAATTGIVLLLVLIFSVTPVTATVFTYGGNSTYGSLQNIINAANSSDVILVKSGTYAENLTIDRPLIVQAEDPRNPPHLVASGQEAAISLTAKGIVLDGLVLSGNGHYGILVQSDNNQISNVSISGFRQGIRLKSAVNNEFGSNSLVNNTIGIVLDHESQVNAFYLNYLDNPVDVESQSGDTTWSNRPSKYLYEGKMYTGSLGNYWKKYTGSATAVGGIGSVPYPVQQNASSVQDTKDSKSATSSLVDRAPLVNLPAMYTLMGREEQQPGTVPGSAPNSGHGSVPGSVSTMPDSVPTIPGSAPGAVMPLVSDAFPVSGPGSLNAGPPPFPVNLVQYWWVVPIALIISAAAGIWYERKRKRTGTDNDEREGNLGGNTTVVKKTVPSARDDSEGLHHYAAHLPPALEKKYPGAEYLAEGGACRVFRAWDPVEGRDVAVKVPIRFDEVTGTQFTKELHVWQSLHHPNIVEIYAANIFPVPYIEMQYVESSLASMKFPLEQKTTIAIVKGVAQGLQYAHEQGIAHRDIKPGNVLIAPDGTAKITDWGLAKAEGTKQSGIIGFSLEYAAPEQLAPNIYGEPGIWTDIYQLGVLFYEMSTGEVPFKGGGMGEVTHAILHDNPPLFSRSGPGSAEIGAIILRCMKKHPQDRYQSVSEIIGDLEKIRF
ncbi:protein kinase [uncultured Methanoregula sp.]|uniref:protein kinase domain-containing protein n=1 Tax=uncultured Methanoregula sp. TaxID=1005933 RepID=UPI002AAB4361|nr:protein kinase [uncultured Methanoregula sp.]